MADTEFFWLVEEFAPNGNSTGRYMAGYSLNESEPQRELMIRTTTDPLKARRFRGMRTAMFRAEDMRAEHGGDWRAVHHGFMSEGGAHG